MSVKLVLEVGPSIVVQLATPERNILGSQCSMLREQLFEEYGLVYPPLKIQDSPKLKPNEYAICVDDERVALGRIRLREFLAISPDGDKLLTLSPSVITDPIYGLPAVWIPAEKTDEAEQLKCLIMDGVTVIVNHLARVLRARAAHMLDVDRVRKLLDNLPDSDSLPAVSAELVTEVLRTLMAEYVPVRDLAAIVGVIAERPDLAPEVLAERARLVLAPDICAQYADAGGLVLAIGLSPKTEDDVLPDIPDAFNQALDSILKRLGLQAQMVVLLCSSLIRRDLRRRLSDRYPELPVLSTEEAAAAEDLDVHQIAELSLESR